MTEVDQVGLRRRGALIILGGAGATALWPIHRACAAVAKATSSDAVGAAVAACVLTPEVTSGPSYIANHLIRRNITENQPGVPLALHLEMQHATTCKAIKDANVEIWHTNALGVYSGYGSGSSPGGGPRGGGGGRATPTNKLAFMRGHQVSDAAGQVIFDTIYPARYRGRARHIHLKVHAGSAVVRRRRAGLRARAVGRRCALARRPGDRAARGFVGATPDQDFNLKDLGDRALETRGTSSPLTCRTSSLLALQNR